MANRISLLAPAKDLEVGKAAILAGADAIYIGAPRFGARQAAGNSLEDIEQLVQFARPFGVQVLVTLNTLLTEDEMPEAVHLAWQLYHIGVHALIIQDLRLLEQNLPPIRLHASTQCDNRTVEHIQSLERLGFSRVVLARELSINEIRTIRQHTHIELEAFVHGALCVCYSGRCYMSEVLLDRSANRGCCAQMCRMRYDLLDGNMQELTDRQGLPIHQRYLLSLQDMERASSLAEMIEAGVTTFKIEGRLKDRDYVTNVVAYYRQQLDALNVTPASRQSRLAYDFTPNPQKTFHRGGIDYFLHGRTAHMANWLTPKSTGEPIGEWLPSAHPQQHGKVRVRLLPHIQLHNGDGLCYGDFGFAVNRIEHIAPDEVLLTPSSAPPTYPSQGQNTQLYRNLDMLFQRSLHAERHLPVTIIFEDTPSGFRLTIDSVHRDFDYPHETAQHPERVVTSVREQLAKLGDTIFVAEDIIIRLSQPYFVPISVLNSWRREVSEMLLRSLLNQPTQQTVNQTVTSETSNPKQVSQQVSSQTSRPASQSVSVISPSTPLMTCRYCLLHELGRCRKNTRLSTSTEPRFLRLQNGTLLTLMFDCSRCEMTVSITR